MVAERGGMQATDVAEAWAGASLLEKRGKLLDDYI